MHMMRLMIDRCLQRPQSSKQSKRPEDHCEAAPGPPTGMPVTGAAAAAAGSLGLDGYMSCRRAAGFSDRCARTTVLAIYRLLGLGFLAPLLAVVALCGSLRLRLGCSPARSLPGMSEPGCSYIYYVRAAAGSSRQVGGWSNPNPRRDLAHRPHQPYQRSR